MASLFRKYDFREESTTSDGKPMVWTSLWEEPEVDKLINL